MQEAKIEPEFFQDKLESFLKGLSGEINDISQTLADGNAELEQIESYLYKINTFYYRSFHERLFPAYLHEIKSELSSLLKLKQQQETIKRDIMTNLQRYALLFNQVKRLDFSLQTAQTDCVSTLESLDEQERDRGIELYYRLQKAEDALGYAGKLLRRIKGLEQDKETLAAMQREGNPTILVNILRLQRDNPEELDYFYRWMKNIHNWKNSILDLLEIKIDLPEKTTRFIRRFFQEYQGLSDQALPAYGFRKPFPACWHNTQLVLHALGEGFPENSEALVLLETWQAFLGDVLLFMDKVLDSGEDSDTISFTATINDYLHTESLGLDFGKPEEELRQSSQNLQRLIKAFPARGEVDTAYFLGHSRGIIKEIYPSIIDFQSRLVTRQNTALASALHRASLELSFLRSQLEFIEEKQRFAELLRQSYLQLADSLSRHKEWITNFKSDLERLLAPRNLPRYWKDFSLRVERIRLHIGLDFPETYLYLLDKHQIPSKVTEGKAGVVLEEEGDIFIFTLDDLQEEIVPYFVVSAGEGG